MRLAALVAGALLWTGAAAQPWGVERDSSPRGEREPSERSDRDDDSWLPYRNSPRSARPEIPSSGKKESPWTPAATETRDPDLARCDRYKVQLESLLREEMRGKNTGAQQRALHEERLRAGC